MEEGGKEQMMWIHVQHQMIAVKMYDMNVMPRTIRCQSLSSLFRTGKAASMYDYVPFRRTKGVVAWSNARNGLL